MQDGGDSADDNLKSTSLIAWKIFPYYTGPLWGNPAVTEDFPSERASNVGDFRRYDVLDVTSL